MNILIPTDLSDESLNSLPRLFNFFKGQETNITLFHAVEPRKSGATLVLNVDDIIYDEAKATLDRFIKENQDELKTQHINIDIELAYGYFELALNRALDRTKSDLVIMTSKSRHGIDKILERKQTLKFIGELKQPLLIVPYELAYKKISTVGVAIDKKEPMSEGSIEKIEKIARNFNAQIELFHINDLTEKDLSFYEDKISIGGEEKEIHVSMHEDVTTGIEQWMDEHEAEVLTMITHNRNFFSKLLMRSVTRDVTKRNSNILLIITQ